MQREDRVERERVAVEKERESSRERETERQREKKEQRERVAVEQERVGLLFMEAHLSLFKDMYGLARDYLQIFKDI